MKNEMQLPYTELAMRLAGQLISTCISVPLKEQYEIYEQVPGSAFRRNGEPLTEAQCSTVAKADIVICKGGKACMAVVSYQSQEWFHTCAPGLCLRVTLGTQSVQNILTDLQIAEQLTEIAPPQNTYRIDAIMLCKTSCKGLAELEEVLSSPEGKLEFGVFTQRCKDNNGTVSGPVPVVTGKALYRLLSKFVWKDTAVRETSLIEKMERIKRNLPSDERYTAALTGCLQTLRELPLTEYFKTCPQKLEMLTCMFQTACVVCENEGYSPLQGKEEILTYQDAVEVIAFLRRCTCEEDHRGLCEDMLEVLCQPVLQSVTHRVNADTSEPLSLEERLGVGGGNPAWNFRAFWLPIPHYFYGVCRLKQSGLGDFIYRTEIYPIFDLKRYRAMDCTPVSLLDYALQERIGRGFGENMLPILYSLMVAPFAEN